MSTQRSRVRFKALSRSAQRYLSQARVAHLATTNADGTVHVIPIVFAAESGRIYFVIDKKRKSANLRRLKNIERTGEATLLVDTYSEDWNKLSFLLLYAKATILVKDRFFREKRNAARLFKAKYPQ